MNTKTPLRRDGGTAIRRVFGGIALGLMLLVPLAAQTRLYVLTAGNRYQPVFKVAQGRPYVMENGKLTPAAGQRFALRKVEEYLPVLIGVRDMASMTTGWRPLDFGELGTRIFGSEFHFGAKFESAYALEDVFLVLELELENTGSSIFVYEVGHLEPRKPKPVSVDLSLEQNPGSGRLKLHVFVGGVEAFNTEQPAAYRDEVLDRMIAKRIASVRQADPQPFYGSEPEYPAALRGTGVKGEAVVTMRVTARGAVLNPVVEHASDPAFGEAALAAVRDCRFLPRVEAGRAIEARVSMPFAFEPPKAPGVGRD